MAPEVAAEAMRAYVEETNRLNRERRAAGAADRKALAEVEKRIGEIVAAIEDGGYSRTLADRLRRLEAEQDGPERAPLKRMYRHPGHPPKRLACPPPRGGTPRGGTPKP